MKNIVNEQLIKVLDGDGKYCPTEYYLGQAVLVEKGDYNYNITTADNIFHLQTTEGWFECPLSEVDWKIFWDRIQDIETDDNGQLIESWQHFPIGSDKFAIYQWMEWFFQIKLDKELWQ
jgi:hypothetical protein